MARTKQQAIQLERGQKRSVSTQFGALCYRIRKDKVQVLLITSRGTGRWVIPKGWPMHNHTPVDTAAREAFEEAGAEGKTIPTCLGIYSYLKETDDGNSQTCVVALFPLKVKRMQSAFPEAGQRKRNWLSPAKAAALVDEPDLAQIIRAFDPARLPPRAAKQH
ncbi:MAG: NUDIX hydrolase [Halocynthiibacter sp.]